MVKEYIHLRQGDILCSIDNSNNGWDYSFVLTADCDIWNDKFGHSLTILPILSINNYMETVHFPESCRREIEKICQRFCELPNFSIDEPFFYSYILESDPSSLESKYKGVGSLATMAPLQRYIKGEMSAGKALYEISTIRNSRWEDIIRRSLSQMRLEYFFLNELPGLPGLGFVAMLRLPQSFPVRSVSLDHSNRLIDETEYKAYKTGSLQDGIRYAVAQCFANVFSRIGLDNRFEQDRKQIIEFVCDSYKGGPE